MAMNLDQANLGIKHSDEMFQRVVSRRGPLDPIGTSRIQLKPEHSMVAYFDRLEAKSIDLEEETLP